MNVVYRTLTELPQRMRQRAAALPGQLRIWLAAARSEPGIVWHSPIVRLTLILLLGALVLGLANQLAARLVPAGDRSAFQAPTRLAILYVACTNPDCRTSYTTRQPMSFKSWPLTCPKCGEDSVYRGRLCRVCGHWYANAPGTGLVCPWCVQPQTKRCESPTSRTTGSSDDDEDPW
mgnify:CR=1 FL=1